MDILYSPKFAREYKKLPLPIKELAEKLELIFRNDPFDTRLRTHKLKGKLSGFYSFSIGHKHRIIFDLMDKGRTAWFLSVGDHDIYNL